MNLREEYLLEIEKFLENLYQNDLPQKHLFDAMRYSLLAGGKRIRPILLLEFCRVCGGDWKKALPAAVSLEMIHTYSLIHDDLPCMDDDDLRRGKATNHKVFGYATALLAGDGLLTDAFRVLAESGLPNLPQSVALLSELAGPYGMAGGQELDLAAETKTLSAEEITLIHDLKTRALISAACELGVLAADGNEAQRLAAKTYAKGIGLAFQLRDDILDVIGTEESMGKSVRTDEKKNTFVKLYGIEKCQEMIDRETEEAIRALSVFPDSRFLEDFANKMRVRNH